MFKVARTEWGLPVNDPIKGLSLPEFDTRRERRLRQGELDRLLKAAADCQDGTVASIIVFALETAMRRGEILAMRFRDIDWREPSLLIPHTKNGHARTIPLTRKSPVRHHPQHERQGIPAYGQRLQAVMAEGARQGRDR
jgi:integrase